jgi:hypothetical protein
MIEGDERSSRDYVDRELRLIKVGSFASGFISDTGAELHERLVDWPFDDETEFSRQDPVYALSTWLAGGWRLAPEWVADLESLPPDAGSVNDLSFSAIDLLACYGLWLVNEEYGSLGAPAEQGCNDQGWPREDILRYRSRCICLAFEALVFAQKFVIGDELTREEIERVARAATARKAADALHSQPGGSRQKRAAMLALWATGKYSSRDICAEQECAALDMSMSTARKALIGSPEPARRSE